MAGGCCHVLRVIADLAIAITEVQVEFLPGRTREPGHPQTPTPAEGTLAAFRRRRMVRQLS